MFFFFKLFCISMKIAYSRENMVITCDIIAVPLPLYHYRSMHAGMEAWRMNRRYNIIIKYLPSHMYTATCAQLCLFRTCVRRVSVLARTQVQEEEYMRSLPGASVPGCARV